MPQNATSRKPPAVKAAVIARFAEGKPRVAIAQELNVDRETVTRILNEPGIKEAVASSRARVLALLPKAERAVEQQLEKGDGDLGLRLLEKSGVLTGESTLPGQEAMPSVFSRCQVLIQQALSPSIARSVRQEIESDRRSTNLPR
jgi:hypothetical protein